MLWKSIWPYLRKRTKPQNHRPRAGPESIPTGTMRGRVPSCGKSVNQEAWQVGALQPCRKWFIPSTKHSSVVTTYSFGMWFEIWLMPIFDAYFDVFWCGTKTPQLSGIRNNPLADHHYDQLQQDIILGRCLVGGFNPFEKNY